jgi:hypothetical protein
MPAVEEIAVESVEDGVRICDSLRKRARGFREGAIPSLSGCHYEGPAGEGPAGGF